jgi:ABC-2 type transport system ATP-binding protein
MIVVDGLRKSFGDQLVLDDIGLRIEEGSVFALLGPNGSGKTTTVHILSTLLAADAGDVRIDGHDLATDADGVRRVIGVTGQFSAIDGLLSGRENLMLMADLHHLSRPEGRARAQELLEQFDLVDAVDTPAATYSGGMKRRLDLAMTLVGSPRVIFLDEPTTGLDPGSRRTMWEVIRSLAAGGVTIFLTTQYLDEADELADEIAVLDHGTIVASGTPTELKRRVHTGHIALRFADARSFAAAGALLDVRGVDEEALTLQVPSDGTVPTLRAILTRLDDHAIELDDVSIHTPDLDDVFFAVTGSDHP